ncbi:hypothetical protein [Flavonifractor sp. An91]|uniref:hypothetical protein n=1 Tax=Flavonifractor sp. An91 TaxID=1965665 RepID=UPI00111F1715|nr:hypothetical protein [Flavonifractor sp. An91]
MENIKWDLIFPGTRLTLKEVEMFLFLVSTGETIKSCSEVLGYDKSELMDVKRLLHRLGLWAGKNNLNAKWKPFFEKLSEEGVD